MDLWIRTQDRTGILKADTIFVFEKQIVKRVYGDDLVKGICLGTYSTEEKKIVHYSFECKVIKRYGGVRNE